MIKTHLYKATKQKGSINSKNNKLNLALSNNHWYAVMRAIETGNFKRAFKIMETVKDTSNYIEQEKVFFVSRYIELYKVTNQKYFLTRALDIVERIMFYTANKIDN